VSKSAARRARSHPDGGPHRQEPADYTIVRDTIEIKTVDGKMLEGDIGYIRLTFLTRIRREMIAKLASWRSRDEGRISICATTPAACWRRA
jgi:hypothetical protein